MVISQPFWPAYMTRERIEKAPNLKLIVTAGIGSDHTDLDAAVEAGITVAEVTYSNSISVSEHVVMMILALVRNYIPSHQIVVDGGWNIADAVSQQLRPRGHAGRHRRRRPDRLRGAAAPEAVRGRPPLHRPPPPAVGGRVRARSDLPRVDRGDGPRDGRGDDQRPALRRDAGPLRRGDDRPDEARRVHRQHGAGQDLQSRRDRARRSSRASSPATPATSGSRSRRRATIPGGRCRTRG